MTALIALTMIAAVLNVTGCKKSESSQGSTQSHQYTCSMHPDVVQDKPGKCPKCGMALTEKR